MIQKNNYIVFGAPAVGQEEIDGVIEVLKSGWLGTGPKTAEFEEVVRKYVGAKYAIGVNSCTAALHLSLIMAGVGPGDEVITTPLTFASTANVVIHTGAKVVFADVSKATMNINPKSIEEKITPRTKAIIPVHLAGRPCNMEAISAIGKQYRLKIIEDAAHALGAKYQGKKIGTLSDSTCFSFYVTKNIMTGEGGMIVTNNKKYAEAMKVYRLHGLSKDAWKRYSSSGYHHYDVTFPGYKYNLIDVLSVMGIAQMEKITEFDKRRRQIWEYYDQEFVSLPITTPAKVEKGDKHAHHLYTLLVDRNKAGISRDDFMAQMHENGVGTGVHFLPIHLYSYYRKNFGFRSGDYPVAEFIGERTVSIPLSPKLTDDEAARVVRTVKKVLRR